jgi:hypothetical protein
MVRKYATVDGSVFETTGASTAFLDLVDSGFVDESGQPIFVPAEDVERARG